MLINTVILFIRDMAPIFLLFAILYSQRQDMLQPIIAGISSGFLLAVVLYFNLAAVSDMADGGGLELLKALVLASAFLAFCWLTVSSKKQLPLALLTCGVTLVNAIHFIIYSAAYWSSQQADMALMMGIIIGLGIACSASILLYMLLETSESRLFKFTVLAVFMAGQVAGVAILLEQINILTEQQRIWDTSSLLADDSEYGHFLNVLVGYEATPGPAYLLVYLLALACPFVLNRWTHSVSGKPADGGSV